MKKTKIKFLLLIIFLLFTTNSLFSQRQMENLGRGVVAVRTSSSSVFISWRLLGTEPADLAFNLYRGDTKVNSTPITESTNFVDNTSINSEYTVCALIDGDEQPESLPAAVWDQQMLKIPLQTPVGYTPNDASLGDLDGDGVYEIILHQAGVTKDNSQDGITDPPIFEAYKLDGTLLWRINLGKNIRDGAHYTQFLVYDFDGDGKAEFACKTADGTTDGIGKKIGNSSADFRNSVGRILDGPEYLTMFNGETGREVATVDYIIPRGNVCDWGDCYGNRVDRFLATVAYLDGVHPSLVMCRGYYTRTVLAAWDFKDNKLTSRWVFDSNKSGNSKFAGQGNHNISVGDVDGDGKDEIMYGAMAVDDDGTGMYSSGYGHGDAAHLSDLDPTHPGLEVFDIHEPGNTPGASFRDAKTGEILWQTTNGDAPRGLAADIDPNHTGAECWAYGTSGLRNVKGEVISNNMPNSCNMAIWWDGDLLRELLNGTLINKWNYNTQSDDRILTGYKMGAWDNNGTKANPCLYADILGDWREEVIWRQDNYELLIFTTTIPTTHRIYTLMHDPIYRLSVAWQNVGYNQPTQTSFFLGDGMDEPPVPNIFLVGADAKGALSTGNYSIKAFHSELYLDITEGVTQQNETLGAEQIWLVSKQDSGYSFYSQQAKKYLNFSNATNGEAVRLVSGDSIQLFQLKNVGEKTFQIRSLKDTTLVFTIADASTNTGSALQLNSNSEAEHQKFTFTYQRDKTDCNGDWEGEAYKDNCNTCVEGNTGRNPNSEVDGIYFTIKSAYSMLCLEANNSVVQKECDENENQVWRFTKNANYHQIYNVGEKKYMGFENGNLLLTNNALISKFRLETLGENRFNITLGNQPDDLFDIEGDSLEIGKKLAFNFRNGTESQVMILDTLTNPLTDCNGVWNGTAYSDDSGVCVGGTTNRIACANLEAGIYKLQAVHSNLCIESATVPAQQSCNDSDSQLWKLTKHKGNYKFQSVSTGKYLSTVAQKDTEISTNSEGSLFRIEEISSGVFHLFPAENIDLLVDVSKASLNAGANLLLWTANDGDNQKFKLQQISTAITEIKSSEPTFKLFPNPVSEILTITISQELINQSVLQVYSAFGNLVESQEIASERIELDVNRLVPGIYFVKILTDDKRISKRFLKN